MRRGHGFSLLAAPLLALIEPALAPPAGLGAASLLSLLVAVRERQAIVPAEIGWALAGYVPSALVAAMVLTRLPTTTLSLLFAALVLLAVALTALRTDLVISPRTLLPAVIIGFILSGRFSPHLDRGPIRPLILLICAASALAVIARTVAGL